MISFILSASLLVTVNGGNLQFPGYIKNYYETTTEIYNETIAEGYNVTESFMETTTESYKETTAESYIAPSCGNETGKDYCIDPPEYPEQIIRNAVLNQQVILQLFFEDEITAFLPPSDSVEYESDFDHNEYYSPVEEFENVCRMTKSHIEPRAAKNTKGEFKFIVNSPKGDRSFLQKVQIGECVSAGSECGHGGSLFSFKTECRQEFLEHKLVSQDGLQVVVDTFKFPSCCNCYSKRKNEY